MTSPPAPTSDRSASSAAGTPLPQTGDVRPAVSVIVPAYREAQNLDELVTRVSTTLDRLERLYEIIVVDDNSNDGTDAEIARLQEAGHAVRLIERKDERGLSSAVLRGFQEARGDMLVCMDADLSHPPETLPDLLAPLEQLNAELVIGSRYVAGASTDERWSLFRRVNSRIATWLARPFTRLRDPMAGYFALPRSVFERTTEWDPIGYKIGLEILVKTHCRQVSEVPIHFADRQRGESKLSWREQCNYLRHLIRLGRYKFKTTWQVVAYCVVGALGAAVDLGSYALLLLSGLPLPIARGLAILVAMLVNFWGNDHFTFRQSGHRRAQRLLHYCAACSLGAVVNYACTLTAPLLFTAARDYPMAGAASGIVAGTLFNFLLSRAWVFKQPTRRST